MQQKILIFCSLAHILCTFCDFAAFFAIFSLKHLQQNTTIIHYYLISKEPLHH
ncbi:hypothetical protein PROSTU_01083 [Providencia stuartii ATCC 25827]|uniref:Uncharacterized protein n=1 Tax=Providencia stuartii ATCC 25827 TaxID=471874 RepID=A0AA86YNE0_PROST|nr:hypothetical protein PROSTU_01083 [Providencia stuartii ATCC 25827]